MAGSVIIVDYDPRWPAMYEAERTRIAAALGDALVAIEHVGSTSVPGLAAKPIIDIAVGLHSLDDAPWCIPLIEELGYEYVPEAEAFFPERRFFYKGPPQEHTHHLHMVGTAAAFWRDHLLFRDHLRAHPDAAARYATLKRRLAERFRYDRDGYTDAKTTFVEATLARARAERAATP